jgi:hypothetical protein
MKKKVYAEVNLKKQLPHKSVKYLLKPFTLQQLYHICVAGVCSHGLRPLHVRLLLPPGASQAACSFGWWLALVCSKRKVLLAGCWWLVCSKRKVLLAGG